MNPINVIPLRRWQNHCQELAIITVTPKETSEILRCMCGHRFISCQVVIKTRMMWTFSRDFFLVFVRHHNSIRVLSDITTSKLHLFTSTATFGANTHQHTRKIRLFAAHRKHSSASLGAPLSRLCLQTHVSASETYSASCRLPAFWQMSWEILK